MKKVFVKALAVLSFVPLLGFGVSSCSDDSDEEEKIIITSTDFVADVMKNISSLSVDASSAATVFSKGAKFDSTGLVVTASYDNGTSEDVTSKVTFSYKPTEEADSVELKSGQTSLTDTAGTYTVTVSYKKHEVTKTSSYDIEVTDSAAHSTNDDENDNGNTENSSYTITDTTLSYNSDANLANITLPAFDVSGSDIFTVSFNATFATDQNDWMAQILKTSANYILTVPNLDPWNNTSSGSSITDKNGYPTAAGAYLANSLAYNSAFTGEAVAVTVSFNKTDKSIVYTLGGKAWVVYTANVWDGGIEEFINAIFTSLSGGTLTFNSNSLALSDLVITKGRASGATAREIALSSSTVSDSLENWETSLKSLSGCVVYSDGSADAITLASDGVTIAYKNGSETVEENAIAVGTYTATVTYGTVSADVALTVTSNYENTVTGEGTVESPYVLGSTLAETLQGKADSIDCYRYMAETASVNQSGTIFWSNPLSGKTLTGFTLSAEIYMTAGAQFDGLLSFFKSGNTADGGFLTVMENGNVRYNSDGFFESTGNENVGALTVTAATWTKVALTVSTDGTVTYYKDGTAVDTSAIENYSGGGNATWDSVNTFLTSFADTIGISVGNTWWKAGYVDAGDYIRSIKIYATALSAEQVAAIE